MQTIPLQNNAVQTSKLLPLLFAGIKEDEPLTVLHIGPALPDTVDFFCDYRCKLHFVDLFDDLPLAETEDSPRLQEQVDTLLDIQPDTRFDLCLFWDIFNYLERDAILALMANLREHLKPRTLAHRFSTHNTRIRPQGQFYGVLQPDTLSCRIRSSEPECYAPHSQRKLQDMLYCFTLERSVLLPDSRLELLLRVKR